MILSTVRNTLRKKKYCLVLASTSPRRKFLLKKLGVYFRICAPRSKEIFQNKNIRLELKQNTLNKALSLKNPPKRALIIAGDTVIVYNNRVLGKPRHQAEAMRFLASLSGKTHVVLTGLAVYNTLSRQACTAIVKTSVTFRKLTTEELKAYIRTGEYIGKAGGYGIQGHGALLIQKIVGDYYNVVGLPLVATATLLKKACRKIK